MGAGIRKGEAKKEKLKRDIKTGHQRLMSEEEYAQERERIAQYYVG